MAARQFDVLVIGSGFGGSLMAMVAHRLGFSVGLIERGKHPRFVIGESTTPLTNLLLSELCKQYDLPALQPLCKWGTWQKHVPHLACGLKRGFTFFHHQLDQAPKPDPEGHRQLMVGASPNDNVADTHWYRPDFDQHLVEQAQALGVTYLDQAELERVEESAQTVTVTGRRGSERLRLTANFLIDATGPRGFLFRALALPEQPLPALPATQALFSHFTDVSPLPECAPIHGRVPPYPPENAAVHHVFPGGWIWVLRFNNGITSAGVAATDPIAESVGLRTGETAWSRLLKRLPALAPVFAPAQAVVPFFHQPRLAFHSGKVTGPRWALLPSAAGVVDPLLSTGFPLTLLGILRLGRTLQSAWGKPAWKEALREYEQLTHLELETTARLVGALYHTMDRFDLFKALSLLYFAAASFSEVARRLGKSHLADDFLLCRNPEFAPQLREICEAVLQAMSEENAQNLKRRIMEVIEPFDLAGLTDSSRDPWYPARGEDILRNAAKLEATPTELAALLA